MRAPARGAAGGAEERDIPQNFGAGGGRYGAGGGRGQSQKAVRAAGHAPRYDEKETGEAGTGGGGERVTVAPGKRGTKENGTFAFCRILGEIKEKTQNKEHFPAFSDKKYAERKKRLCRGRRTKKSGPQVTVRTQGNTLPCPLPAQRGGKNGAVKHAFWCFTAPLQRCREMCLNRWIYRWQSG